MSAFTTLLFCTFAFDPVARRRRDARLLHFLHRLSRISVPARRPRPRFSARHPGRTAPTCRAQGTRGSINTRCCVGLRGAALEQPDARRQKQKSCLYFLHHYRPCGCGSRFIFPCRLRPSDMFQEPTCSSSEVFVRVSLSHSCFL